MCKFPCDLLWKNTPASFFALAKGEEGSMLFRVTFIQLFTGDQ